MRSSTLALEITDPTTAIDELIFHPRDGGTKGDHHDDPYGPGDLADPASNQICGTDNDDVINGTDRRDVIYAKDGDDTVSAKKGDDVVFGGRGDDVIFGGEGNDWLSGGSGDDRIYAGGDGWQNILNGGAGQDDLYGAQYKGVQDIFQFTRAKDSAGDAYDTIWGFRTGEDKIHLPFDSDRFKPGHQSDFVLVDEEDAGTAGTMYIQDDWYQSFTGPDGTGTFWLYRFMLHGHIDNDGIADFSIMFDDSPTDNDPDWGSETLAEDMLVQSDFLF